MSYGPDCNANESVERGLAHAIRVNHMQEQKLKDLSLKNAELMRMCEEWEQKYGQKHEACVPVKYYEELVKTLKGTGEKFSNFAETYDRNKRERKWYRLWLW